MGFAGYFLIVSDFIKWAQGAAAFPSGPAAARARARSSPGRSPSPISTRSRFGLLFERFLNPERVSMPDFDIDFCQERRDEVIRYVQRQIRRATASRRSSPSARCRRAPCCATSAACCRCRYGQVDRLAKLVPNNPANPVTLARGDRASSRGCSEERDERARRRAPVRHRAEARRPLPPRLDPCGGRGDRRPAARRAGAALPRSALGHAGHAVRL